MEYLIFFIEHIIKTAEFFAVEGFPIVPIELIPAAIEGIIFNLFKIISIYLLI